MQLNNEFSFSASSPVSEVANVCSLTHSSNLEDDKEKGKIIWDLIEQHAMKGNTMVYDSELRVILKKHGKMEDAEIAKILNWIHEVMLNFYYL